jgi:pimeloyl-ACP methyl ester carboxylesterase
LCPDSINPTGDPAAVVPHGIDDGFRGLQTPTIPVNRESVDLTVEYTPPRTMKCKLRDGEIYYEIYGSGRPLLILHGGYLDHRHIVNAMEPVFSDSSSWKRIYPDLPGHGHTTIAANIENHDQVLGVLSEFIGNICPNETYAVAGESRGGFLARGLAAKESNKIDGLLLIVPGRYAVADPENLPTHVTLESADELLPELAENEIGRFKKLVVQNREILEKIRKYKLPAIPLADTECQNRLNENYQISFDLDSTEYTFLKPTLVLLGRFDVEVGYRDALKVIENHPRATYAILDKAGHSLSWEQPELFVTLVKDWLKRVESFGS